MPKSAEEVAAILAGMLKKRLYVVLSTPTDKAASEPKVLAPGSAVLADHLDYMVGLEKDGVLFAAGPFLDENGKPKGPGLIVLRAVSLADAEAIARRDPLHANGYRSFSAETWQVNEGGFTVAVNFSDQTFTLD